MLFSQFIVDRLQLLTQATRGYGDQITERSLYEALAPGLSDPAEFAPLLEWGLTTGLLTELNTAKGRMFGIDRNAISPWRSRANGESPDCAAQHDGPDSSATSFNKDDSKRSARPGGALPGEPIG